MLKKSWIQSKLEVLDELFLEGMKVSQEEDKRKA